MATWNIFYRWCKSLQDYRASHVVSVIGKLGSFWERIFESFPTPDVPSSMRLMNLRDLAVLGWALHSQFPSVALWNLLTPHNLICARIKFSPLLGSLWNYKPLCFTPTPTSNQIHRQKKHKTVLIIHTQIRWSRLFSMRRISEKLRNLLCTPSPTS